MEIVCLSSNLLDNNATICSFAGQTIDPCENTISSFRSFQLHNIYNSGVLPKKIDVKGLPLGTHKIHVTATDVFGSTAVTSFDYLGKGAHCKVRQWERRLLLQTYSMIMLYDNVELT